jgi:transposase InsO family protein
MVESHSRRGNCHDNTCIESFFSHLKTEKIYLTRPKTADLLSIVMILAYPSLNCLTDWRIKRSTVRSKG